MNQFRRQVLRSLAVPIQRLKGLLGNCGNWEGKSQFLQHELSRNLHASASVCRLSDVVASHFSMLALNSPFDHSSPIFLFPARISLSSSPTACFRHPMSIFGGSPAPSVM